MNGNVGGGKSINTEYSDKVALGLVPRVSAISKWGGGTNLDTGTVQSVWELQEIITPLTSASTFTITYNNSTDGLGTTGATQIVFYYLDENRIAQIETHVLGNTGTDVTSFTGLGINRLAVLAGTAKKNTNAITVTATTGASNQAYIPALAGVTQQCFFFSQASSTSLIYGGWVEAQKPSGSDTVVTFKFYVRDFTVNSEYLVDKLFVDTSTDTKVNFDFDGVPFPFAGPALYYITASAASGTNIQVNARFFGRQYIL